MPASDEYRDVHDADGFPLAVLSGKTTEKKIKRGVFTGLICIAPMAFFNPPNAAAEKPFKSVTSKAVNVGFGESGTAFGCWHAGEVLKAQKVWARRSPHQCACGVYRP